MRVRYTPARSPIARRSSNTSIVATRAPRARSRRSEVKAFIAERIARLGDVPVRHRVVAGLGVHALYLGRYPYIVYYRVGRDEISIVHIRHAARRPWQGEGD